jgi:hypothetical protein
MDYSKSTPLANYFLEGNQDEVTLWPITLVMDSPEGSGPCLTLDVKKIEKDSLTTGRFAGVVPMPFSHEGLAVKFSRLKVADILTFANSYGFLGVRPNVDIRKHKKDASLVMFDFHTSLDHFETIYVWEWHIKHVKRLIKLYRAVKDNEDIEEIIYAEPVPNSNRCKLFWHEDKSEAYVGEVDDDLSGIGMASVILHNDVAYMLDRGVRIKWISRWNLKQFPDNIKQEFPQMTEKKYSPYLLAAIYYDLWQTINNMDPVKECPVCLLPFRSVRVDATFCTDACRKKHSRHNNVIPIH